MKSVGAFAAKNRLGNWLDLVEQGEEIAITRHGKEVALLVPPRSRASRGEAEAIWRRMRQRAKEQGEGPFSWPEWKKLRDEGRR